LKKKTLEYLKNEMVSRMMNKIIIKVLSLLMILTNNTSINLV